jgi:hypothetical protein
MADEKVTPPAPAPVAKPPTTFETAVVRVRLNKFGSDVPKAGVTPPEAVLLHVLHQANNGGATFGEDQDKIEITKDKDGKPVLTPRTDRVEFLRLQAKYGRIQNKKGSILESIYDPRNLNLPHTFKEIEGKWSDVAGIGGDILPTDQLTGQPVVTAPPA